MRLFGPVAIRFRVVERSRFRTFAARLLPGKRCRLDAATVSPMSSLEARARVVYSLRVIRVVFAEDSYLVREGVRRLLEGEADIELVAVCEDLDSLLAAIEAERPDVVVTDIRMPPTE